VQAAANDGEQLKPGTDGGAIVRGKSENSDPAAVAGRRSAGECDCETRGGGVLCSAALLADHHAASGARSMACWRSAYHRFIAALALASSTRAAVNGEGAARALSVVSVPETGSAVLALPGLSAATGDDDAAAMTGGLFGATIFTAAAPTRPRPTSAAASDNAGPASMA